MTIKQILDYVMSTPENTNRMVLQGMLEQLAASDDITDATAIATDILSGKIAYNNDGKVVGTAVEQGEKTFTPTTSNQTLSANTHLTGVITIQGDPNLIAENIKSGVTIFGIEGTYTGEAN